MPSLSCTSHCETHAPIIVSQDRGVTSPKHIANNREKSLVYQYKIDGEAITVGPRCDYLVINEDLKTAYLIELKGSDLLKAAEQLDETAQKLSRELKDYDLSYRIVAHKCKTQATESTAFRKYRRKWAGKNRFDYNRFDYKTREYTENIS